MLKHILVTIAAATAIIVLLPLPAAAQAKARTEWGTISLIEAGWAQDTMAVWHTTPMVNPSGCTVLNAGYATDPADPGHSLFHTILLSALLNHKEVSLLISDCAYDKPRIIAVQLR